MEYNTNRLNKIKSTNYATKSMHTFMYMQVQGSKLRLISNFNLNLQLFG